MNTDEPCLAQRYDEQGERHIFRCPRPAHQAVRREAHRREEEQAIGSVLPQKLHSLQGLPCTGFSRPAFADGVIDEGYSVAVTDIT